MLSIIPRDRSSRNLWVLWIGCFLAGCTFSLVMPFLPRFIASLGVTENLYTWTGLTFGVSFMASGVMSPIWGNLADRYGRKLMIIRSGIAIGVVYLLMAIVTNPYQLLFLRFLNGAFAGFIPSSMALMATNLPDHLVGRSMALLATAAAAGTIIGPMLGGLLSDIFSIRSTMVIAGVMILGATLMVGMVVKERLNTLPVRRTSTLQDVRTALAHPGLTAIMLSTLMVAASIQSLEPLLTAFVPTLHQDAFLATITLTLFGRTDASAFTSGFVFGLPGITMVLFAAHWSRLGERIGYTKVITLTLFGAAILVMPQSLVTTVGGLMLLRFLYGAMTSAVLPATNAILALTVHPTFRGRAFGINNSAMQIGAVLGSVAGGLVADWFGKRSVFLFSGLLLLVTCVWVHRTLVKRAPDPVLAGAPDGASLPG